MARSINLWSIVVSSLVLGAAGCGGAADTDLSQQQSNKSENEIIAGVDAKSAAINAIGSLVEISRYTTCYYRSSNDGGTGGSIGMAGTTRRPAPPPEASPAQLGTFDLPSRLVRGSSLGSGGAGGSVGPIEVPPPSDAGPPGAGGSTGIGGRGRGGAGGWAGGGGTTCEPVEVVSYWPFCSASLIGPTAVLSAKHCLEDLSYIPEAAFAVGPDAFNPTAIYPIVDWETEAQVPSDERLWGNGSDVGVVHLGTKVTGVTPVVVGTLNPETDINTRFSAIGYGVQNNDSINGTRKAGSVTLRGIGGNYADYAFGGYEGFKKAAPSLGLDGASEETLLYYYGLMALLDQYQAFVGGKPGDAQPCYGDSGGPLVAMRNGVRTAFGVVTGGMGSDRLRCDYGGVYAVFGPAAMAFIQQALLWVDPCEGVTVAGHCDGSMAIRCTDRNEGKRRLSITECDQLGLTCGLDANGKAACVDP